MHLGPPQPHGQQPLTRRGEVSRHVTCPRRRVAVPGLPVELDHDAEPVEQHVAVDHAALGHLTDLATSDRKTVGPDHAPEEQRLERRVHPRGHVVESAPQLAPPGHPLSCVHGLEQSLGGGSAPVAHLREDVDRPLACEGRPGDVQGGLLQAEPRWATVPLHAFVETREAVKHDAAERAPLPGVLDRDMDRVAGHVQGRAIAERGLAVEQHCCPGPAAPGRRPGVVDVDARMDPRQVSLPHEAAYVVVPHANPQELAAMHDTGLVVEETA